MKVKEGMKKRMIKKESKNVVSLMNEKCERLTSEGEAMMSE